MDWLQEGVNWIYGLLGIYTVVPMFLTGTVLLIIAAILHPAGPTRFVQLIASTILGVVGIYILLLALHIDEYDSRLVALIVLFVGMFQVTGSRASAIGKVIGAVIIVITFGVILGFSFAGPPTSAIATGVKTFWSSLLAIANTYHH